MIIIIFKGNGNQIKLKKHLESNQKRTCNQKIIIRYFVYIAEPEKKIDKKIKHL